LIFTKRKRIGLRGDAMACDEGETFPLSLMIDSEKKGKEGEGTAWPNRVKEREGRRESGHHHCRSTESANGGGVVEKKKKARGKSRTMFIPACFR